MKKLDELMDTLDQRVDRAIGSNYQAIKKYFTVFSATLLSLLALLFVFKMYYSKPYFVASLIQADLCRLEEILHKIDNTSEILALQNDHEPIDFLTVKSFVGSMVGGINLAHPQKWAGPYLEQNPSIQGKFYELVRAKDGYFVVPGQGVMLPHGAVMGKDVVITRNTMLGNVMKPEGYLSYRGIKLAVKVSFKIGDWHRTPPAEGTIQNINDIVEKFNEAMPFTQNSVQKRIVA